MGSPRQLTRDQEQNLRAQTSDAPERTESVHVETNGTFTTSVTLHTNDVWLVRLDPQ